MRGMQHCAGETTTFYFVPHFFGARILFHTIPTHVGFFSPTLTQHQQLQEQQI